MLESSSPDDASTTQSNDSVAQNTPNECVTPEMIAQIGVPLMKRIAQLASRDVVFPLVEQLESSDHAGLDRVLSSNVARGEAGFWVLVSQFHAFQQNGGPDTLAADGCPFRKGEDQSSYLARIAGDQPEKLQRAMGDLLERIGGDVSEKAIHIFQCSLSPDELQALEKKMNSVFLKQALIDRFEKKGYGDHCEVAPVANGRVGIVIVHGTRRAPDVVLDVSEQRNFRNDRRIRTDIVLYSAETHTLIVQCYNRADAPMYAEVIGAALGFPYAFTRRCSFDLSSLLENNLGSELMRAAREMQVARVELRHISVKLAEGGIVNRGAGARSKPCLTDSSIHHVPQRIPQNEMLAVKLRIVKTPDGKQYVDLDVTSGTLKLGAGMRIQDANELLRILGVWETRLNV